MFGGLGLVQECALKGRSRSLQEVSDMYLEKSKRHSLALYLAVNLGTEDHLQRDF